MTTKCSFGKWMNVLGTLLLGVALVAFYAPAAFAVDDGPFELDGNAADDSGAGLPDDWETLLSDGSSLVFTGILADPAPLTIYSGGSKDTRDLTQNGVTSGSSPDKDEILNAYAAAYNVGGELVIYFGADRYATAGDAFLGFWFLENEVNISGGNFTAGHTLNDILVLVNFENGGLIPNIEVLRWDPTCSKADGPNPVPTECGAPNLRILAKQAALCTGTGGKTFCAITNGVSQPAFWPYEPKPNTGGSSGVFPPQTFFEGGINLSQILGFDTCVSSFLAESRSSSSETAQLKDLVLGGFPLCGLEITKACAGDGVVNASGTSIHYTFTGTVENTGLGPLYNVSIVDNLPAGATNVTYSPASGVFASIGAATTENWSVQFDVAATSAANSAFAKGATTNVVPGNCGDVGTVCSDSSAIVTCTASPTNTITISKMCGVPTGFPNAVLPETQLVTASGLAAVRVNFSGVIENTGQTQLSGITLADNPSATINVAWPGSAGVLEPGATANYSGYYMPSGVTLDDLGSTPGRYAFVDEIKLTGATAFLGDSPGAESTCTSVFTTGAQACDTASCLMCPEGTCPIPPIP